ncbi:MAG: DUF4157 domain-containing protein [Alicyclobacillus sp.]|nr:DUF4157 domain-containing protein [Alicyclobacillus sp.]
MAYSSKRVLPWAIAGALLALAAAGLAESAELRPAPWVSRLWPFAPVARHEVKPAVQPPAPVTTQTTGPTDGNAAVVPAAPAPALWRVKTVGQVPAATVAKVQSLAAATGMAEAVARALQLPVPAPVQVYLAQSATDYRSALQSLGVPAAQAQRFSRDTGGFTQGTDIVVPLYQNPTDADLANTLAHELTHVTLNAAGVTAPLPSWLNEGLAVTLGMYAQSRIANPVVYDGYAKQMAETVLAAAANEKLLPLASDEGRVLAGNASYDVELQDWLAVSWLVHQCGWGAVAGYLQQLRAGKPAAQAFQTAFARSPSAFNEFISRELAAAAHSPDTGVQLELHVAPGLTGQLHILTHGSQQWQSVSLQPGRLQLSVDAAGHVHGPAEGPSVADPNPPDAQTTYLDMAFDQPQTYQGQPVAHAGFALDVHQGMYAFVNGWVTYADGHSSYVQVPQLLGVSLQSVTEPMPQNPIEHLLHTPAP